jgi:undecaprenyl phosphate-alpha-L-ara4FN deformylase
VTGDHVRTPRLALKVDCDTYEGTKAGIPKLLALFDRFGIRASFFFTLGPDRSGRAIARILTHKGFLRKMIRSRAVSLYGPRTALYGTLLPAPHIGRRLAPTIRAVETAGHEVGVHGWDHVRWHDRLDRMSEEQIARDYGLAHREFQAIFGHAARCSAAPGWHATATSLTVEERYDLRYTSNTRGGGPFLPEAGGRRFTTLEIPTTLPTWDEMLNAPPFRAKQELLDHYRALIRDTEVHSIHTEVEGTALIDLFEQQLECWQAGGVTFVTLGEIAADVSSQPAPPPARRLVRTTLPGRAGRVTASTGQTGLSTPKGSVKRQSGLLKDHA